MKSHVNGYWFKKNLTDNGIYIYKISSENEDITGKLIIK